MVAMGVSGCGGLGGCEMGTTESIGSGDWRVLFSNIFGVKGVEGLFQESPLHGGTNGGAGI